MIRSVTGVGLSQSVSQESVSQDGIGSAFFIPMLIVHYITWDYVIIQSRESTNREGPKQRVKSAEIGDFLKIEVAPRHNHSFISASCTL